MMPAAIRRADPIQPVVTRFQALSGLDPAARQLLVEAAGHTRAIAAYRDVMTEGKPITEALLMLDGWAARVRYLLDGRRQILSFVLPGDMLGLCDHKEPLMSSTVVAITPVTVCRAPGRCVSQTLDEAYAVSRTVDEANLLAQITRLGRLSAYERIIDLLLELLERLTLADQASKAKFTLPLTQEMLADALGLTSVHVNRMLQQARRAGDLTWSGREIVLHDVETLQRSVGRRPVRVSAAA